MIFFSICFFIIIVCSRSSSCCSTSLLLAFSRSDFVLSYLSLNKWWLIVQLPHSLYSPVHPFILILGKVSIVVGEPIGLVPAAAAVQGIKAWWGHQWLNHFYKSNYLNQSINYFHITLLLLSSLRFDNLLFSRGRPVWLWQGRTIIMVHSDLAELCGTC